MSDEKKDNFDRFAWRNAVFADPKTPANAKCLAFGIAEHVNGETGEAFPSTKTLAKVCGFSEKWVRKTIPVLQDTGWIECQLGTRGRGDSHCNRYRINPEKRTPCTVFKADPVYGFSEPEMGTDKGDFSTVKADFLPLKADPVSEEPLNHLTSKKERGSAARTFPVDRESDNGTATDGPVARTAHAALQQPADQAQQHPPSRNDSIGTAADPAFAEVYERGREVLGADADAVTAELLGVYEGDVMSALDTLAAAEEEESGASRRQYVEKDIEAAARDQAHRTNRQ